MNAQKFIETLAQYYRREVSPFEVKVIARKLAGYSGEQLYRIWCKLTERPGDGVRHAEGGRDHRGRGRARVQHLRRVLPGANVEQQPVRRVLLWLLQHPPAAPDGATGEHLAVDHVFYENAISADQGGTELFRAAYLKAGGKTDQIGVYLNAMR